MKAKYYAIPKDAVACRVVHGDHGVEFIGPKGSRASKAWERLCENTRSAMSSVLGFQGLLCGPPEGLYWLREVEETCEICAGYGRQMPGCEVFCPECASGKVTSSELILQTDERLEITAGWTHGPIDAESADWNKLIPSEDAGILVVRQEECQCQETWRNLPKHLRIEGTEMACLICDMKGKVETREEIRK